MPKSSKGASKPSKPAKSKFLRNNIAKGRKDPARRNVDKANEVEDEQSKLNSARPKSSFPQQLNSTKHSYVKPMQRKPAK